MIQNVTFIIFKTSADKKYVTSTHPLPNTFL